MVADFEDGNGLIPVADRYRVEVEFKAIDEAVLPWPILSDSDSYFSGSAPFALLSLKLRQSEWGNHFQVSFCQKPLLLASWSTAEFTVECWAGSDSHLWRHARNKDSAF